MKTLIYLAPEKFVAELINELQGYGSAVEKISERLVRATDPERAVSWAQNVWFNPIEIEFDSISQAAKSLRALNAHWSLYPCENFRRASLIQNALPRLRPRPVPFQEIFCQKKTASETDWHKNVRTGEYAKLGSWTLLAANRMLASSHCLSPFPHGEVIFVEDRYTPPSRAYLKLWEVFTRFPHLIPEPNARVADLGSSPGGWTWVLQSLGCRVLSVDRADLSPEISSLNRVEFRRLNAFTLRPEDAGPIDWFFSDIISEPSKLLGLIEKWLSSGVCQKFICTIKFKGETDHAIVAKFLEIPGSVALHLYNNKHELTWIRIP